MSKCFLCNAEVPAEPPQGYFAVCAKCCGYDDKHSSLIAAAREAVEAFTSYDSEAHPLTTRYYALFNSMQSLANELKKV